MNMMKRGKAMTYQKIFADVKKSFAKADVKKLTESFAFQFNITGEGEGIFYAAFKDGVLSVEPYDYKDRDAVFTADGATFTAIASGKLDAMKALSEGKLFIDGNYELAKQLLLLIPEKKAPAKKTAAKKPAAKKAPAKAAAKKAAPAKAAAKKEAPKAAAVKKEAVKAAPAKKEAPKAETVKKEAPAKKAPDAGLNPVPKKLEKK